MTLRTAVLVLVILGGGWIALVALNELLFDLALAKGISTWRSASHLIAAAVAITLGTGIYWRREPNRLAATGLLAASAWHLISVAYFAPSGVMLLLAGILSFFVKSKPRTGEHQSS